MSFSNARLLYKRKVCDLKFQSPDDLAKELASTGISPCVSPKYAIYMLPSKLGLLKDPKFSNFFDPYYFRGLAGTIFALDVFSPPEYDLFMTVKEYDLWCEVVGEHACLVIDE
jgi:hypothetical protein